MKKLNFFGIRDVFEPPYALSIKNRGFYLFASSCFIIIQMYDKIYNC